MTKLILAFLFIGILLLLGYFLWCLWQLWKSGKNLFAAGSGFGTKLSQVSTSVRETFEPRNDLYSNPQRRKEAKEKRAEIRKIRREKRELRLRQATNRWDKQDFQTLQTELEDTK